MGTMMTRRAMLWALLLACWMTGPAVAQDLPDPSRGWVAVLEPSQWMGEGTRGPDPRGIVRGRTVRVVGQAYHPSGVRQVSINGVPVLLWRDGSGNMRFSGRIAATELERDVEIVAYPQQGEPIARVHGPDGSVSYGALSEVKPLMAPLAAVEVSTQLRVSLAALPEGTRRVVAASFAGSPGVVPAVPGAQAHLTLAADGTGLVVLGRDGSVRHRVEAASPDEGAAALMPVLAQELGALQLEVLSAPREAFPLELSFATGDGRLRVGDGIAFRASAGRAGYFTLVDLGTDGTVTVLYPIDADEPRVSTGVPVLVPDPELREPLVAAEPFGRGVVRAFVTPRPLVVTPTESGGVPAEVVLRALRDATTDPASGRALPWATATLEYHIIP
jgi:hypothetical protein